MRDIRQELEERISQVQTDRQKKQRELTELDATEAGLKTVLASENALWERMTPQTAPLFSDGHKNGNGSKTLSSALLDLLSTGSMRVDKLKDELEKRGYPFGEKAPGRVINFSLVGMQNRGLVSKAEDGEWKINEVQKN